MSRVHAGYVAAALIGVAVAVVLLIWEQLP